MVYTDFALLDRNTTTVILLLAALLILFSNTAVKAQSKQESKSDKTVVQPTTAVTPDSTYKIAEFPSSAGTKCAVLKEFSIIANNRDNWYLSAGYCPIELSEKMKKFDLVHLTVHTMSSDWRYENYSDVTLMADGEKLRIVDHDRKTSTWNDRVYEHIKFSISPDDFFALAKASRIDLGVGNEKYKLPSVALEALRDFSTHVHPLKTKEEKQKKSR